MFHRFIQVVSVFLFIVSIGSLSVEGQSLPRKAKDLEPLCLGSSNVEACTALADLYEKGRGGVKRDYQQAARFHMEVCKTDNGPACASAVAMAETAGDTGYLKQALHVQCRMKDLAGCRKGFEVFGMPDAPNYDAEQTGKFLGLGCAGGGGDLCFAFALHFSGTEWAPASVTPNPQLALEGLNRACTSTPDGTNYTVKSRNIACSMVAGIYKDVGSAQANTKVLQALNIACNGGFGEECLLLAAAYEDGKYGLTRDNPRAEELMGKACAMSDPTACETLAYNIVITQKRRQDGIPALVTACEAGAKAWTCEWAGNLAWEYYNKPVNKLTVAEEKLRTKALTTACEKKYGFACYAYATTFGPGYARYVGDWVKKSCKYGYQFGCDYIAEQNEARRQAALQEQARREAAQKQQQSNWNQPVQPSPYNAGFNANYWTNTRSSSYSGSSSRSGPSFAAKERYKYNTCMSNRANWGRC